MKINKLNYENYVIDYIEGTLSKELKKDFDLFLEKNEEVYDEIKDYISAPVFEETDEVFTEKKSLRKKGIFNPYYLLALLPFLIGGFYFLSGNNTENTTPEIKIEPTKMIQNFAQQETNEVNQLIKQDLKVKPSTIESGVNKEKQIKKVIKKQESSTKKAYLASSTPQSTSDFQKVTAGQIIPSAPNKKEIVVPVQQMVFTGAIAEVNTDEINTRIPSQSMIEAVASLEALPIKGLENEFDLGLMNARIASITPQEKSLIDQIMNKNSWLEMVTPASFNDIDLKESLAIESNVNINTSRKILNAFIPESLVK